MREIVLPRNYKKEYYDANALIDTKPGRDIWLAAIGVFLGYSYESIAGFIQRSAAVDEILDKHGYNIDIELIDLHLPEGINRSIGTPFSYTGYIPTPRDIILGYESVVGLINKNRFSARPFNGESIDHELIREFNDLLCAQNATYIDMVNGCIEYCRETIPDIFKE